MLLKILVIVIGILSLVSVIVALSGLIIFVILVLLPPRKEKELKKYLDRKFGEDRVFEIALGSALLAIILIVVMRILTI